MVIDRYLTSPSTTKPRFPTASVHSEGRVQAKHKQGVNLTSFMLVDRDILITAARLRAEQGLKLPDAIHAATAQLTHCERWLTNDARFSLI